MNYDVTLKFGYDYPLAVKDARHILRIRLRDGDGQSVTAQSIRIRPLPDEAASETDFFGNGVDHILLHRPHDALAIEMRARVRMHPRNLDLSLTPSSGAVNDAALRIHDAGPMSPAHFLGTSRLVQRSPAVADYLGEALRDAGRDAAGPSAAGSDVLALTRRIRDDFTYAPGTTRIDTPVADVFRTRQGVCQDFAHVMIAGLRGLGIPTAYVSGLLRTLPPPGKPRLEGTDAMHAWVKVWLGHETGWVGFDPTNGVQAGGDHIEVAIGRDYADVAPIGGVLVTSSSQKTRHSVDVVPVGEATSAAQAADDTAGRAPA